MFFGRLTYWITFGVAICMAVCGLRSCQACATSPRSNSSGIWGCWVFWVSGGSSIVLDCQLALIEGESLSILYGSWLDHGSRATFLFVLGGHLGPSKANQCPFFSNTLWDIAEVLLDIASKDISCVSSHIWKNSQKSDSHTQQFYTYSSRAGKVSVPSEVNPWQGTMSSGRPGSLIYASF